MIPASARSSQARTPSGKPKGNSCVPLTSLKPGARARLCHHPEVPVSERLRDLGFVPDTPLVVVRRAPLGDPLEVELRGYRLCLRQADLAALCVTPDPSEA